jgi:hypothetical protein
VKLVDLEPVFERVVEPGKKYEEVDSLDLAQGVRFECPQCGKHQVLCWFRNRGVPDSETPGPGRWEASGTGAHDLTLSPSVHLSGPGCGWHGFVRNGEITG